MSIRKVKIGDVCDIIKGSIGIQKAIPGEYPMVVTAEERASHNEYQIDGKAVITPLVSSTGHGHASIKRLHYQEGKFALGSILAAIIVRDESEINPYFLYIYLSYFKDQLLVPLMKGSANVSLSVKKIESIAIIIPSMERQLEIIQLEKNKYLIDYFNAEIQTQKQLLSQLKQSILQEAIQGMLTTDWREQNPSVESAAQLLQRIKAEKQKLINEKKIKKEKPLPPITKEEIPFELPEGWVWCRLGEICSKTGSGSTPKGGRAAYPDSGIKFLRSQNVYDDGLRLDGLVFISDVTHARMSGTEVQSEDLLLNITGGSIGRCCIVPKDFDTANINQHVAIIRSIESAIGYFLHKVIISPYFQKEIIKAQTGAGREGLPKNKMDNVLIPLPSLLEIEAIVQKVESLMDKCRALETEITHGEQHAQLLMQAVLKEAFESKEKSYTNHEPSLSMAAEEGGHYGKR